MLLRELHCYYKRYVFMQEDCKSAYSAGQSVIKSSFQGLDICSLESTSQPLYQGVSFQVSSAGARVPLSWLHQYAQIIHQFWKRAPGCTDKWVSRKPGVWIFKKYNKKETSSRLLVLVSCKSRFFNLYRTQAVNILKHRILHLKHSSNFAFYGYGFNLLKTAWSQKKVPETESIHIRINVNFYTNLVFIPI